MKINTKMMMRITRLMMVIRLNNKLKGCLAHTPPHATGPLVTTAL